MTYPCVLAGFLSRMLIVAESEVSVRCSPTLSVPGGPFVFSKIFKISTAFTCELAR